jgi:hypothetical protein
VLQLAAWHETGGVSCAAVGCAGVAPWDKGVRGLAYQCGSGGGHGVLEKGGAVGATRARARVSVVEGGVGVDGGS